MQCSQCFPQLCMLAENLYYERRIEAYAQARTEEERGDILEAMEEEDFLL